MTKKFISPAAWFSFSYPATWFELEDESDSFLFCNPDKWNGNFRISAFRGENEQYAKDSLLLEQKENPSCVHQTVGKWACLYSNESFEEEGVDYTSHYWLFGERDLLVECSFTVQSGDSFAVVEPIIASVVLRDFSQKVQKEIIPIRLQEIAFINESFNWVAENVKKYLSKDFEGSIADLQRLQQLIDKDYISMNQPQIVSFMAIAIGVILENEVDGVNWVTVVDGKNEYPSLYVASLDTNYPITTLLMDYYATQAKPKLQSFYQQLLAGN